MSIFFFVVVVLFCFLLCVCTGTFHGLLKGYFNIYFSFEIHYSFCVCVCVFILVVLQEGLITAYTRKMVPINKRASSFPIIVCHPALPSFHLRLLVVSFV